MDTFSLLVHVVAPMQLPHTHGAKRTTQAFSVFLPGKSSSSLFDTLPSPPMRWLVLIIGGVLLSSTN